MRKGLSKKLRTCFSREFQSRFPRFELESKRDNYWTWRWQLAPTITYFVGLQVFDQYDQFVIEIGWSNNGEFPWDEDWNPEIERANNVRERLGHRVTQTGGEYIWDLAAESTLAFEESIRFDVDEDEVAIADTPVELAARRIEPFVRDSLEKLKQHALPLFQRVAGVRGVPWPDNEELSAATVFLEIEEEAREVTIRSLRQVPGLTVECDQKIAVGPCSEIDAIATKNGRSLYVVTRFSLKLIESGETSEKTVILNNGSELFQQLRNAVNKAKTTDTVILQVAMGAGERAAGIIRDALGSEWKLDRWNMVLNCPNQCNIEVVTTQSEVLKSATALLG